MENANFVVAMLIVLNLVQGFWIFRLIDRLMSRSYYDYEISKASARNLAKKGKESDKIPQEPQDFEDLGYIQGG